MPWHFEERRPRRDFDNLAQIHHSNPMAYMFHHPKIMRDE
jgi:hypothetical protein